MLEDFEKVRLREAFLCIVKSQIGLGEIGGNNAGPTVAKFKRIDDFKSGKNLGAWCARGSAWCLEEALGGTYSDGARHAGVSVKTWKRRSRAALGLARMLRDQYGYNDFPKLGDLVLWKRPGAPWMHHISPIVDIHPACGTITVAQFNSGPMIKTTVHSIEDPSYNRNKFKNYISIC